MCALELCIWSITKWANGIQYKNNEVDPKIEMNKESEIESDNRVCVYDDIDQIGNCRQIFLS